MSLLQCRSIELDHVKPSLVHEFFQIQNIGMIPLHQFKEVIPEEQFKKCEAKTRKTWYNLTKEVFFLLHVQDESISFSYSRWNTIFESFI
jgi:hypothetical protein